jgi:hypothetical protein
MAAYGGAAAAAAAAEAQRQRELEEELMTQYSPDDLANEWEFKIVRSSTSAFRRPATLQKLIDEEARAGWVMVEKFDDDRVRFKRRRGARAALDLPPGYDPYRTQFGMSSNLYAMLVVGGIFLAIGLFFLIIALLTRG